jgi:hypothetical protein
MKSRHTYLVLALALFAAGPLSAQEGFPDDRTRDQWTNDLIVYLWAANMDATSTVGTTEVPIETKFSDLFGLVKFATSAHYEGRKGNWGVLLDGTYINLGEDGITVIQGPGPGQEEVSADYRYKIWTGEAAVVWSPLDLGSQQLHFLGGIRYTGQDFTLALLTPGPGEPPEQGFDESWVDPIVGARWGIGWGKYDRWFFVLRSDVGGFGVGSDLAFNVVTQFGYRFSRVVYVGLGGKYLYTDYSSGTMGTDDYFAYKGDQFGILLGLGFRF